MTKTFCPECDYLLKLSANLRLGQQTECKRCRTKLIIAELNPLELDTAIGTGSRRPRHEKKRLSRRELQKREYLEAGDSGYGQ